LLDCAGSVEMDNDGGRGDRDANAAFTIDVIWFILATGAVARRGIVAAVRRNRNEEVIPVDDGPVTVLVA
jgi:hypothetical protein